MPTFKKPRYIVIKKIYQRRFLFGFLPSWTMLDSFEYPKLRRHVNAIYQIAEDMERQIEEQGFKFNRALYKRSKVVLTYYNHVTDYDMKIVITYKTEY